MAILPSYGSTVTLFDDDLKLASKAASRQQNSMFRDFLRHVRLPLPGSLFGRCFAWRSSTERRKVAVYQSRRMAALTSLLHFIPFGGAITLLALYWTKYWIGQPPNGLTALQFVAKFHEILMQASLVDVLVYFIRAQALQGYIPLGALSGAAQASQLSYLWSLDFVSTVWSKTLNVWRRVTFGLVVSAMLLMITAVGPSSAVLMIPRPGMETVTATESYYLNSSKASSYPMSFNNQSILDITMIDDGDSPFTMISQIESPDSSVWTSASVDKRTDGMVMYTLRQDLHTSRSSLAVATMPALVDYDILRGREYCMGCDTFTAWPTHNVKTVVMRSLQPFVVASCTITPDPGEEDIYSIVDESKKILVQPRSLYEKILLINQTRSTTEPSPVLWMPAVGDPSTMVAMSLHSERWAGDDMKLSICTVSAFWRMARTTFEKNDGLYQTKPEIPDYPRNLSSQDLTPITLSSNLLEPLNPALRNGLGIYHLAQDVVSALAEVPGSYHYDSFMNDSLDDSSRGQWIFDSDELRDFSELTPFHVNAVKEGFGFGTRDRSAQLSVAVITAYCFITLLYISYITITGHTSIAWTSPTELIMLALQSKEPSNIGHVSVGIDSMGTLRRNVGIRVSTVDVGDTGGIRERLELVFEDDEETERRDLTKVIRGRAY